MPKLMHRANLKRGDRRSYKILRIAPIQRFKNVFRVERNLAAPGIWNSPVHLIVIAISYIMYDIIKLYTIEKIIHTPQVNILCDFCNYELIEVRLALIGLLMIAILLQTCSSAPVLRQLPALKKEHHYLYSHPKLKSTNSAPTAKLLKLQFGF